MLRIRAPYLLSRQPAGSSHISADVCVYGQAAGGNTAAIAAKRSGATVAAIGGWRENRLGGMVSGGLSATDLRNRAAIGGLALEFFERVWTHYGRTPGDDFTFEPKVAQSILETWYEENNLVPTWTKGIVAADMDGPRLRKILTRDGITIEAKQWIDASYERDLVRAAKITMRTGREGRDEFGEDLAGIRWTDPKHNYGFSEIDPYRQPGIPASGLLPGINLNTLPVGSASVGTQAYNFRLTMTRSLTNGLPLPTSAPPRFNPARYELFLRWLAVQRDFGFSVRFSDIVIINGIGDTEKADINAKGPFSIDDFGGSWSYITDDYDRREWSWKDHEDFIRGFLWVCWSYADSRVPATLRDSARVWRLCADEFTKPYPGDEVGWPTQIYSREYGRMRGVRILTQADAMRGDGDDLPYADQVVALGSYWADSHGCQRIVIPATGRAGDKVVNEGGFFENAGGSNRMVPIPFDALLPRPHEAVNITTTWGISATHVFDGLSRMEPTSMAYGHATGIAAAMAAEGIDTALHSINVADLRAQLISEGASIGAV